jgi:hypothetical protein
VRRAVTILAFALIAAGPLYQLIAFRIDTGTFQWMQTAFDEPFYIRDALTSPLRFDERTLSRIPMHVMQAIGIKSFDSVAIAFNFLFSFLAFGAAWVLAGTLTKSAIERAAWTFALVFGFQVFSFNSEIMFSPPPAQRLEAFLGMPWLFAADPFPYFDLYRTPEPQTTWVVFFSYLALLVRFADSLNPIFYRIACLITPLFVFCYITPAICAWLLFIALSIYAILFLRLPLKLAFLSTISTTAGGLAIAFLGANGRVASATVFDSHLPLFRVSIVIAFAGLVWLWLILRRTEWRLNARLCLAGACASIPLITLNQQIITGKIVLAQQWELYCTQN